MLGFRYVDDVRGRGTVTINALDFDDPAADNLTTTLDNVRLVAPQNSAITFGARYGHRRHGTGTLLNDTTQQSLRGATFDRMNTELFDVEVDVVYELNDRVTDFVVTLPPGSAANVPGIGVAPLPNVIRLGHNWKNQLSVRLGGDINVIPGTLALRLGGSYETSGVNTDYAQLDFVPGERISVSAGATLRLGKIDISLAYLHIFQGDITSTARAGIGAEGVGLRQIASTEGDVINQGTFSAQFDVFSLGANYHF